MHPSTTIICAFFQTYIHKRFADGAIDKYVFDVYLDSQERVWIVDFNVWGSRTDGLLFEWKELVELGAQVGNSTTNQIMPEVRVVTKDMKSMTYDPLSSYRGPTDVMNLLGSGNGSGESSGLEGNAFDEFMQQCVRPSEL